MKYIVLSICLWCFCILSIQAQSYCVLSDEDQTILEGDNIHQVQSVASISKVMTAIIAIQHADLHQTWILGDEIDDAYGSMVYLKKGQKVSMNTMLHGLMLRSGNDCAIGIAHHVGGGVKEFVKWMNEKAKEIGMTNTIFRNPSGLDEEDGGNCSTAYDMALLMSYAMKNETFRTIAGKKYYTTEWKDRWKNKNRLLFEDGLVIAGKTGFTKKAGRTLITTAKFQTKQTTVVTLGYPDDFAFHKQKHHEMLASINYVPIVKKGVYQLFGKEVIIPKTIYATTQNKDSQFNVLTYVDGQQLYIDVSRQGYKRVYSVSMI